MVLHTTYVLRVPHSCGVVLVFLVLAGNSFWCYVYLAYNTVVRLCQFYVVVGKVILYEYLTVTIVSQKY